MFLRFECTNFNFGWSFAPDPAGGSLQHSPDCLVVKMEGKGQNEGTGFKGKGKREREGERECMGGVSGADSIGHGGTCPSTYKWLGTGAP